MIRWHSLLIYCWICLEAGYIWWSALCQWCWKRCSLGRSYYNASKAYQHRPPFRHGNFFKNVFVSVLADNYVRQFILNYTCVYMSHQLKLWLISICIEFFTLWTTISVYMVGIGHYGWMLKLLNVLMPMKITLTIGFPRLPVIF